RNTLPAPELRFVDWRRTYPDLRVERIVASDVLYESRCLRPVAEFVERHLTPDGFALIVDSFRAPADAFDSVARHCGVSVKTEEQPARPDETPPRPRCRVFTLRRRA
ncbi:MAG: hypothetical protein D6744_16450, partial [Planctomycetota bacterium]